MDREERFQEVIRKVADEMEKEAIGMMTSTYSAESDWNSSAIGLEDIRAAAKESEPLRKKREEYEKKVIEYCMQLRPCPLIIGMYGCMPVAFGVNPRVSMDWLYQPIEMEIPKLGMRSDHGLCFSHNVYPIGLGSVVELPESKMQKPLSLWRKISGKISGWLRWCVERLKNEKAD